MRNEQQDTEATLVPWYIIVMALVVFHTAMFFGLAHAFGSFDSILLAVPQCAMGTLNVVLYVWEIFINGGYLYMLLCLMLMIFLLGIGPWLLYRTIRRSL